MEEKIRYIEQEILKEKANIFNCNESIEESKNKLFGLYGALETIQMIEKDVLSNDEVKKQ